MQRARRLLRRSGRDKERAFLIEGPNAVAEALKAGIHLQDVFYVPGAAAADGLARVAGARGAPVHAVAGPVMKALSDTATPQGIVAVAAIRDASIAEMPNAQGLAVMLVAVRDPGNAGTLVRSAVAAGAEAVVFSEQSVDPYNAKTVRASAGMVLHIHVVRGASVPGAIADLKALGHTVVGADAASLRAPDEVDLSVPVTLVLGNEAWGMAGEHRMLLDEVVGIPMPGPAESLNVGTAGSILLFEAVRQRRSAASEKREVSSER